ncbi:MAG: hypothetical protein HKL95_05985 [Phycisphaerae bacterium]|nr:hypothetical protein [Phycisphaerae bacterium]
MPRTKNQSLHPGHHSGPQIKGDPIDRQSAQPRGSAEKQPDRQKSDPNEMRPGHQSKPGQTDRDNRGQRKPGQSHENGHGAGPTVPGHAVESPGMNRGPKPYTRRKNVSKNEPILELEAQLTDSQADDEDEKEEAAMKAPFQESPKDGWESRVRATKRARAMRSPAL